MRAREDHFEGVSSGTGFGSAGLCACSAWEFTSVAWETCSTRDMHAYTRPGDHHCGRTQQVRRPAGGRLMLPNPGILLIFAGRPGQVPFACVCDTRRLILIVTHPYHVCLPRIPGPHSVYFPMRDARPRVTVLFEHMLWDRSHVGTRGCGVAPVSVMTSATCNIGCAPQRNISPSMAAFSHATVSPSDRPLGALEAACFHLSTYIL